MSIRVVRSVFGLLLGCALSCVAPVSATQAVGQVFLSNSSGERYSIGELQVVSSDVGSDFSFALASESFGDYFLSMRPFRCLEGGPQMLCYLPYPYDKPTVFSVSEMRPLEYDFLFIHRSASDYGIDPWNGLYYKIARVEGKWVGQAHAVDLNILASPPENGEVYPLSEVDLHRIDASQLWLPTLEIEGLAQ